MANAVVNRQVNVYINSGEAAKAYDTLIKREKLLNAELAKTTDPKRIKQLGAELDKLKDPIDRAAKKMRGEMAPSIRELELATRRFLNEFKKTGDPETLRKFQQFQAELNKAKLQLTDLGEANKGLTSFGIFKGAFWANLAAGAMTGFFSSLNGFFKDSVNEALAADQATNRLKSTLDNLGRSDAFDRITAKADELAQQFRYLDNDDIVGVFTRLIDYGKLTERQMNDLLPVIIDFAAKSQISLDEASSVIIKALEGNGKALKEYGINIKDAGSESERLGIIMGTLKDKVDGAGEAFANSAEGGIATARQELANLKEDIGNETIPILNKLLSFVSGAIKGVKQLFIDVRSLFTGENRFGDVDNQLNKDIARQNLEKYKNDPVYAKLDKDRKIANLQIQAGYYQKIVADAEQKLQQAKFDGVYNQVSEDLLNTVNQFKEYVKIYNDEIALLENDKPLGISPGGGGGDNEAAKKAIEERKKLLAELAKIKFDQSLYDLPALDKELALVDQKYAQLRERAKGEKEILIRIEELYLVEKLQLIDSYTDREVQAWMKALQKTGDVQEKKFVEQLQRLKDRAKEVLDGGNDGSVKKAIALSLQNQDDDEKAKQEEQERNRQKVLQFIGYSQQISSIMSQMDQFKTQQENAELERDRRLNERKIRNLDARLKKGLISQQQYDKEVAKIEKDQEKKEKAFRLAQFQRQKRQNIVQALMNTAEAVTEALPNMFLAAIAGAAGAAQVAMIASQKPPEFARGGRLGGRSHADGGNAVVDGRGRKIAEVEAGEGIVNKRTMADGRQYTLSGTPSQIISRLNGLYGNSWEGGATLIPGWRRFSPQPMNYSAMKRVYADGGIMAQNGAGEGADNAINENLLTVLANVQSSQALLAEVLSRGIVADVSLTRFEEQQDRLTAIRRDATLKG